MYMLKLLQLVQCTAPTSKQCLLCHAIQTR